MSEGGTQASKARRRRGVGARRGVERARAGAIPPRSKPVFPAGANGDHAPGYPESPHRHRPGGRRPARAGALPSYLGSGDPYYLTAEPIETNETAADVNNVSDRRYPFLDERARERRRSLRGVPDRPVRGEEVVHPYPVRRGGRAHPTGAGGGDRRRGPRPPRRTGLLRGGGTAVSDDLRDLPAFDDGRTHSLPGEPEWPGPGGRRRVRRGVVRRRVRPRRAARRDGEEVLLGGTVARDDRGRGRRRPGVVRRAVPTDRAEHPTGASRGDRRARRVVHRRRRPRTRRGDRI